MPVSKIVPQEAHEWFFEALSENAPFTWGDNDRSMISAPRFLIRALEIFEASGVEASADLGEQLARDMEILEEENILIDLES